MGRNFPSRGIRHRFDLWRDRRRYPWRYPETETRRFRRRPANTFRRRFFVIRSLEDEGRIDHYIFAECPNYPAAMEVAALARRPGLHRGADARPPRAAPSPDRLGQGGRPATGSSIDRTDVASAGDERHVLDPGGTEWVATGAGGTT